MSRLDRYLAFAIFRGISLSLMIIVGLSYVLDFIAEADKIGRPGYGLAEANLVTALYMVQRAYEVFPMATLIGALAGLGMLASHGELAVMRALGKSIGSFARVVVLVGVFMGLFATALGEWAAPQAIRYAQQIETEAQGRDVSFAGQGFWARDGDYWLRAERIPQSDRLDEVRAYEISGGTLRRIITAPTANFVQGKWSFAPATVTRFSDSSVDVQNLTMVRLGGELQPQTLDVVVADPWTLAISALYRYVQYLENNDLKSDEYRLALWLKVSTPLAIVTMLLISLPLIFQTQRTTGVGQQIFLGVLIGLAFFLLNRFLGNVGLVYGLPPALSALAPTLLFLLIALVALRRVR